MKPKTRSRAALALAAISAMLLLDACVCRPVHVGSADGAPTTLAEYKASLQ